MGSSSSRPTGETGQGPDAPPTLSRGDTVGRYLVLSVLGAGGMGVVYAAHDPELDRKVALKLMRSRAGTRSKGSAGHRRLLREAQAMARLNHPNVVTVHDVGEHSGGIFLAMEFVDGMTLDAWLVDAPRTVDDILDVFLRAGEGLAAAHEVGLVHRDFKPQNVMVGRGRKPIVRVMDFGLVRDVGSTDAIEVADLATPSGDLTERMTVAGTVMGTPAYMAPEQHQAHDVTPAADQFAYCVALYRALFGIKPFPGKNAHELATNVIDGVMNEPPEDVSVPDWITEAITRGLRRAPEDRWPSLTALLAALRHDPRPRRRRVVVGIAVLGVTIAAFATHGVLRARVAARCKAEAAEITELWNPRIAGQIEEAMAGTGLSYAGSAFEKTRPRLDAYADAWAREHEQACRRAELDDAVAAKDHRRAIACFESHKARFNALVNVLGDPTEQTVRASVSAAANLPPIEDCTDQAALARRAPVPTESLDRAIALEGELGFALGLSEARAYDEAAVAAARVVAAAEELEDRALAIRARAALGKVRAAMKDGEAGVALLEQAFQEATAAGTDEIVLELLSDLVYRSATVRGDYDAGLAWGQLGEAWVERLDAEGTLAHADLLNALAVVHNKRGGHRRAIELLERALKIKKELLGPDHPGLSSLFNNLGVAHDELEELDAALQYYSESLRIWETSVGADHPAIAVDLNNLAILHMRRGEPERAARLYQRALKVREQALGADHPKVASILDNLAALELSLGRTAEAQALNRRAVQIRETSLDPNHPELGTSIFNLGRINLELGDFEAAVIALSRALEIRRKALGPTSPKVAAVHVELGKAYGALGRHEDALREHEEAVRVFSAALGADSKHLVPPLAGIAAARRSLGDREAQTAALTRALALGEKHGIDPKLLDELRTRLEATGG